MTKQSWKKLDYLVGRGTDLLFNDEGTLLCSVGAIQDFVRTEKQLSYKEGLEDGLDEGYKDCKRDGVLSYAEGRKGGLEGITKEI